MHESLAVKFSKAHVKLRIFKQYWPWTDKVYFYFKLLDVLKWHRKKPFCFVFLCFFLFCCNIFLSSSIALIKLWRDFFFSVNSWENVSCHLTHTLKWAFFIFVCVSEAPFAVWSFSWTAKYEPTVVVFHDIISARRERIKVIIITKWTQKLL